MSTPNTDVRSPITDALETLGMIHYKEEKRDAIHLAVEPVIAGFDLEVGQRVGIINGVALPIGGTYNTGVIGEDGFAIIQKVPYHGIVDPFLPRGPKEGEKFWFVLAPRLVKSLRHVWEHPDFPAGS